MSKKKVIYSLEDALIEISRDINLLKENDNAEFVENAQKNVVIALKKYKTNRMYSQFNFFGLIVIICFISYFFYLQNNLHKTIINELEYINLKDSSTISTMFETDSIYKIIHINNEKIVKKSNDALSIANYYIVQSAAINKFYKIRTKEMKIVNDSVEIKISSQKLQGDTIIRLKRIDK